MTAHELRAKQQQRDAAAETKRHWVRLTSSCNNRCLFCLDAHHPGPGQRPWSEIHQDIAEGRRRGATRLVLSGGEPTLHRAFVDAVAAGREAGYDRVQVITNGRLFAHEAFLARAVAAGLGEVTISLHGHRSALHDELVGVPGAFGQTLRGIRNALAQRGLVVNVDIVICGPNVEFIDKIMTLAIRLGVREFDLLQVQPSGRAADQEGILFDLEAARPSLERALNYRKRPDLFLWTNRLPLAYLEGHEELIQSPTKLLDEINGRRDQAELLLTRGEPFRCRGPLCQACFMAPLCDELHQYAERLHRHSWTRIVVDLRDGCPPSVTTPKVREVQVVANDLAQLEKATKNAPTLHPDVPLSLWLGRPKGLTEGLAATPGQLEGRSLERLASDDVIVLQAALDAEIAEVEVTPKKRNLAWLEAHLTTPLVLRARPGTPLSTARREDIPPHELADLLARSVWTVEDWPHCLAGGRPVRWTDQPLLAVASGAEAATGLDDWVRHFAARRYRTFSSRCPSCSHQACRGQLVQLVRAFGLKWLQPEGSGG